jgi:hypothetical protein
MKTIGLDRCLAFINCEITPAAVTTHPITKGCAWKAVTVSRQSGAGGHSLGERLAELLQARMPGTERPWTVFDKNLVERVLEDHHLPKRLERFMPEDKTSEMSGTLDELFGLHPPSLTLVRQTCETILRLVDLGNVIIIGRGAHLVTGNMEGIFHVRLVGSVERRAERLRDRFDLTNKAAMEMLQQDDRARQRYAKQYFGKDLNDPLLYHLTINTDKCPPDKAADLIAFTLEHCPPVPEN